MDGDLPQMIFAVGTPLKVVEQKLIEFTLEFCKGDKRQAAELLGVSLKTVYNKTKKGEQS